MAAILVIDDDSVSRMILTAVVQPLCNNTHTVQAFPGPKEALDWILQNDVVLVLTAHQMPEMSGIEFVRALRDNPVCVDIPVIMLSADDNPDIRDKALRAGITDFTAKPVDHAALMERCRDLLGNSGDSISV
jgi:CheY-like chemotaxis protein